MTENTAQIAIAELPARQYLALLELSKAVASQGSLSELLHDLAGQLHGIFEFHYLGVMLHDGAGKVMRLHVSETDVPAMRQFPTEIPIEGSISG